MLKWREIEVLPFSESNENNFNKYMIKGFV